jgi:nucleoside-diphosphate-sugar epimerase
MSNQPTWLVTGGAGFIGSHLLAALVERGQRVRVLDNFSSGKRAWLEAAGGDFELVEGSITDIEACRAACRGVTRVLHHAALPSVQRSVEDPLTSHDACATGTLNMLIAARDAGANRFIYAGSSSAYGDTPELPKRESMPTNPRSPYAVAKLMGEQYTRAFSIVYGVEGVVLRYFNVFGPRQDPTSLYSAVVPKFIAAALEGRAPTIYGDGEQSRDFTHVKNVVEANLKAATAPAERVVGRVFNVGCGERISVNRLWREIRGLVGVDVEPDYATGRKGDVRDSLAALDEIRAAMGFEPVMGLREGLEETVNFLRVREKHS